MSRLTRLVRHSIEFGVLIIFCTIMYWITVTIRQYDIQNMNHFNNSWDWGLGTSMAYGFGLVFGFLGLCMIVYDILYEYNKECKNKRILNSHYDTNIDIASEALKK